MADTATLWREVYERLTSPHGERYAAEISEINRRYPVHYVLSNGKRSYSDLLPFPSQAEIEQYHDFGHLWTLEALSDFKPRYCAYLASCGLPSSNICL